MSGGSVVGGASCTATRRHLIRRRDEGEEKVMISTKKSWNTIRRLIPYACRAIVGRLAACTWK